MLLNTSGSKFIKLINLVIFENSVKKSWFYDVFVLKDLIGAVTLESDSVRQDEWEILRTSSS